MKVLHGTYIGPDNYLRGNSALLMLQKHTTRLLAQFDSLALPMSCTHNWTEYPESTFKLDTEEMSQWIMEQRK